MIVVCMTKAIVALLSQILITVVLMHQALQNCQDDPKHINNAPQSINDQLLVEV